SKGKMTGMVELDIDRDQRPREREPGRAIFACLFLLVVPAILHFTLSRFGFPYTDEGLMLAMSRRILAGEVPHRDFISIRPVGSSLLHIPEVLFGGERTFWISRAAVWVELCAIAWAWVRIVEKRLGSSGNILERVGVATVVLTLCTHNFPILAWHTID